MSYFTRTNVFSKTGKVYGEYPFQNNLKNCCESKKDGNEVFTTDSRFKKQIIGNRFHIGNKQHENNNRNSRWLHTRAVCNLRKHQSMVQGDSEKDQEVKFRWWNEVVSIPIGLIAFYFYPDLALLLENKPAIWGVGTLQKFVFAFSLVSIANGIAGLLVKLVVPNVFDFKDREFQTAFQDTTPFQKCVLLLLWFSAYFFGFILSATAI